MRSALWALGWALGAAAGVALGAYLTATSGAGAPGAASLDMREMVRLPLVGGIGVFVVAFAGYLIRFTAKRPAYVHGDADADKGEQ